MLSVKSERLDGRRETEGESRERGGGKRRGEGDVCMPEHFYPKSNQESSHSHLKETPGRDSSSPFLLPP